MEALERSGLPWYITGSVALGAYGSPRQTMDADVVIAATSDQLGAMAGTLSDTCYYSEPVRFGRRTMAALIDRTGGGKVDLIVRDDDAWGRSAMERRRPWDDPALGPVWISSLEDLILAKLEWSDGSSELQLRDCRNLLRMNVGKVDRDYLAHWAAELGITRLLTGISEASDAS